MTAVKASSAASPHSGVAAPVSWRISSFCAWEASVAFRATMSAKVWRNARPPVPPRWWRGQRHPQKAPQLLVAAVFVEPDRQPVQNVQQRTGEHEIRPDKQMDLPEIDLLHLIM